MAKSRPHIAYGIKWHKLEWPTPWKPEEEGSELVGYYLGQTLRHGQYGQYSVALFTVPSGDGYSRPFTVSGTTLISRLDAAEITKGALIRITFQGWSEGKSGHSYKKFDVYVGEGKLDDQTAALLFRRMEDGDWGEVAQCGICRQPGHNMGDCPNYEED